MGGISELHNQLVTVDIVHRRITQGLFWEVSEYEPALAAGATMEFLFQLAATHAIHLFGCAQIGGDAFIDLFEAPTVTDVGAAKMPINCNRMSGNMLQATVTFGPTTTDDGLRIHRNFAPATSHGLGSGIEKKFFDQYQLDPGQTYLLRVINDSTSAQKSNMMAQFYENLPGAD